MKSGKQKCHPVFRTKISFKKVYINSKLPDHILSTKFSASFNFTIFEALQGLKSDSEKLQFRRFTS